MPGGRDRGAASVSHDVVIAEATTPELQDALSVQRDAFGRVARMFGIPTDSLSAVTETLDDLTALRDAGSTVLVAKADGRVVGTVRAVTRSDGVVEVGRLAVHESLLRRGLGRALMLAVESRFSDSRRFELFTGAEAEVPLALYEGLGYRVFRRNDAGPVAIVWLAKGRS